MNAVIIDFDGTMADSFDNVLEFLLSQTGRDLTALTVPEREALKGLSMKDLALRVGIASWKLPLVYFRGKAKMAKRMHSTPPFPGMEAVLAALHQEGYQLYILSSNSRRNILRFLTQHGLSGYFKQVYGNAGWFRKGPALKRLMQKNNLRADDTIYVGDEVRDIVGAHYAGMPSVAVTWGFGSEDQLLRYTPTFLVRKTSQLQQTLTEWGRPV